MKQIHWIILGFFLTLLLLSCATPNKTGSDVNVAMIDDGYSAVDPRNTSRNPVVLNPNANGKSNETLANMISKLPGVMMAGRGRNVSFKVRGSTSFFSGSDPLYVLNGRPVGTNFAAIAQNIDPNEVSSLQVLSGPDAAIYGTRGANGVILIKTAM